MKLVKKLLSMGLAVLMIMGMVTNVSADTTNPQAGDIRYKEKMVVRYYQNQGPINDAQNVKAVFYKPLTSETIQYYITSYLAFDNDGYPIPWEDIQVNQTELQAINDAINQGRQWFTDQGITKAGQGVEFPLTLTTPDGRVTNHIVELNIGADVAYIMPGEVFVKGNDISYDVANGPLDWATLKTLADVRLIAGSNEIHNVTIEETIRELNDINDAIAAGDLKTFPIHGIFQKYIIGDFNVTLTDSTRADVTYLINDGTDTNYVDKQKIGDSYTILNQDNANFTFARAGYQFTGWNTQADGQGTAYQASDIFTLTGDVELYAQWVQADYKLTYDANGATEGTAPTDVNTYQYDDMALIIGQGTLEYSRHEFIGWNTQADGLGTTYQSGDVMTIQGDVTLYAMWKEMPLAPTPEKPNPTPTPDPTTPLPEGTGVEKPVTTGDQTYLGIYLVGMIGGLGVLTLLRKKKRYN